MLTKTEFIQLVNKYPQKRDKVYTRGFYFTNDSVDENAFPFFGLWKHEFIAGKYNLLVHPKQQYAVSESEDRTIVMVGHAYNPFRDVYDNNLIASTLLGGGINVINELTGVFTLIFIDKNGVRIVGDPTCMQTTYYGLIGGNFYISSHSHLIGDMLDLEWDKYIKELTGYRFYKLLGNSYPGNLSQYKEVKRLIPNHEVLMTSNGLKVQRFFWPQKQNISNERIADRVSELMHKNMQLIAEKWKKPAISMTGGCDSKTTLACAVGYYDKFRYFSYTSEPKETVDADAAKEICKAIGQEHWTDVIPENDDAYDDIEVTRAIMERNIGYGRENNRSDVRKRRYYEDTDKFDVEVKSWASEIGRAYYSKRFNGRKKFGKPTPRKLTTMYKFFAHNRQLVRKTDKVFKDYLMNYFERAKENPIDWQEQLFWEFRVPSWNGRVITGEHRYSFDITIPYNNRMILQLLVSAPIEDRINDTIYKMIRAKMNPVIDNTGIAVTNVLHTDRRAQIENLYYIIHSHILF